MRTIKGEYLIRENDILNNRYIPIRDVKVDTIDVNGETIQVSYGAINTALRRYDSKQWACICNHCKAIRTATRQYILWGNRKKKAEKDIEYIFDKTERNIWDRLFDV